MVGSEFPRIFGLEIQELLMEQKHSQDEGFKLPIVIVVVPVLFTKIYNKKEIKYFYSQKIFVFQCDKGNGLTMGWEAAQQFDSFKCTF